MHGYGYILGHSDHSAFTAQVPLAVLRVVYQGKYTFFESNLESNFGSNFGSSPCFVLCRSPADFRDKKQSYFCHLRQ